MHFAGYRNFHIDHFRPKHLFPRLTLVYHNLYYSCSLCNTNKGDTWPTLQQARKGISFGDPCKENLYDKHFHVDGTTGLLTALTPIGKYTNEHLRLYRTQLNNQRRRNYEWKKAFQEARVELESPNVPTHLLEKTQKILKMAEQLLINPPPPYEPPDL
jgi:hypothetical protein